MNKIKNEYNPDYNVPLFEFIQEYLETYNWSIEDLYQMSGIDKKTLILIYQNKFQINEDVAKKLSDTLGLTQDMWMRLGDKKGKKFLL